MRIKFFLAALFALIPGLSAPAYAYIGPGAAVAFFGYILGPIAALIAAVAMIVAWPFYAIWRKRKKKTEAANEEKAEADKGNKVSARDSGED